MLTAANLNFRWSPVPGVSRDAGECFPMKMEEMRGTELEGLSLGIEKGLDHLDDGVKLFEPVEGFLAGSKVWIGDYFGI